MEALYEGELFGVPYTVEEVLAEYAENRDSGGASVGSTGVPYFSKARLKLVATELLFRKENLTVREVKMGTSDPKSMECFAGSSDFMSRNRVSFKDCDSEVNIGTE